MTQARGPWTPVDLLQESTAFLQSRGLESARLEAERMLAAALGIRRLDLSLQFDKVLSEAELAGQAELEAPWRRDADQVPPELAYMVGLDGVERALARIAGLSRQAGIPALLLLHGARGLPVIDPGEEVERLPEDLHVLETARRQGLATIDAHGPVLQWLRDHDKTVSDLILSARDWHPNPTWHGLLARIVCDEVVSQGLLPER